MRFDPGFRARALLFVSLLVLVTLLPPGVLSVEAQQPRASPAREAQSGQQTRRANLAAVRTWGYQLRILNLAPLAASNVDLLVVDHGYSARRDGKIIFDAAEVEQLKRKPDGGRRVVLAYMSIGEAEQYRFYWKDAWCQRATAPSWIGPVNPSWPGNYPARFWEPEWQQIILAPTEGYLARVQAQGFDGIYLDRTDVYTEWVKENPASEAEMIRFLSRIAASARQFDPKFLIVMQNAEELLVHRTVRQLLDGVAKEDLLHGVTFTDAPNDADTVANSLKDLNHAKADRIPVFVVEYLADAAKIDAARQQLAGFGFIPYFAPRMLDRLVPQPGDTAGAAPTPPVLPPVRAPAVAAAPNSGTRPGSAEGGFTCLRD